MTCPWCSEPLLCAERFPGRIRCSACGIQVTDPWPTDDELDKAYATFYRPKSGRFSGPGDALLRRTRGRLARRIDKIAPPGPILDVGSGDGSLLDALRTVGRSATGLERKSDRPDVRSCELDEVDGRWAAVVMWHSLEHLRAPRKTLRTASDRLLPGGVLVVAVPNIGSFQAHLFGSRWFALDIPRHLTHIPADVLTTAVEETGLRLERISAWRGGQGFFGWVDGFVACLVPGRPSLYDAIRRPEARSSPMTSMARARTLAAAVILAPFAAIGWWAELATGRGGTAYLEARRARTLS